MGPDHKPTILIKRSTALLVLLVTLLAGPAHPANGPEAVVARLNDALLQTMRAGAEGLDYRGRYELLAPVLRASFAFDAMTRIAIGPAWRSVEPGRQAELERLFAEMSIANFASRFDDYGGERFELLGSEPGVRDAVLVKSRIVRQDESPVGLDYLLRDQQEGWRIIDVFLDSRFSELARQRSEFGAILRAQGVDALILTLEDKIDELSG